MSGHLTRALECLDDADRHKVGSILAEAALRRAQVHATLACAPPDPELYQLIAAAKNVLAHAETQHGTGYVRVPDAYLVALQTCTLRAQGFEPEDAPPPPPPDPPRKPSAKFHPQGTNPRPVDEGGSS